MSREAIFDNMVASVPTSFSRPDHAQGLLTDFVRKEFYDAPSFCRTDELTNSFNIEFDFDPLKVVIESVDNKSRVLLLDGTKIITVSPSELDNFSGYFVTALILAARGIRYEELFEGSELTNLGYIRLQRAFNSSFVQLLCIPDYDLVASSLQMEPNDVAFERPVVGMFVKTGDRLLAASKFLQIGIDKLDVVSLQNKFVVTTRDQLVAGQTFFLAGDVLHVAVVANNLLYCICSTYDYSQMDLDVTSAPVVALA